MTSKHIIYNMCLLLMLGMATSCSVFKKKSSNVPAANASQDSSKVALQPYDKLITDKAITSQGLITVHQLEDKYYFELPDSLFGAELLVIPRLSQAPSDMRGPRSFTGFVGDPIGGSWITFEKGPSKKIFIRRKSYTEYLPDSTASMFMSVKKNNLEPIVASFPIASVGKDSSTVVIDVTQFLNQDNDVFFFGSNVEKQMWHFGALHADKSYVSGVRSFPTNTEIRTIKTYDLAGLMAAGVRTVEINTSIVLLPKEVMKPRLFDERIGYFTTDYVDFESKPQGVKNTSMVNRWKLEPKAEDVEKYLAGELVEPKKQIVFYIDPTTPEEWVPYLIQGVNDWNVAFEKAGFKNAIVGKIAPTYEEDSTFSLEDARHSAIVYKPSQIPNASGPSIADPRSGEILESHINWYHNVMKVLHDWYMIQAGPLDPGAQKAEFDTELMGQLIRFVCSHEVGHTLGLRHNFGSSSTVPVEKLRDKEWLKEHGHTPSIMDYARFNYVAQPEDSVGRDGIFPRINDYDFWAVEWGYRWFPDFDSKEEEETFFNEWVIKKQANPRLWFGSEMPSRDPRCQNEDLGDNAMKAGAYGIKNLQRVIAGLPEWTKTENEGYSDLESMFNSTSLQFDRYILHVMRNVGGMYYTPKKIEQGGKQYQVVPASKQREAMDFLDEYVFDTPLWLYNKAIADQIGYTFVFEVGQRQNGVINNLIDVYTLSDIIENEMVPQDDPFTLKEFFERLNQSIFTEAYKNTEIDIYRRNLQKIYVDRLIKLATPTDLLPMGGPMMSSMKYSVLEEQTTDISTYIKVNLKTLKILIDRSAARRGNGLSKEHLLDLSDRIEGFFED